MRTRSISATSWSRLKALANVGIELNITDNTGKSANNYDGDTVCRLDNLWVWYALQDGVVYQGTHARGIVTSRVRVRHAGRHAFSIQATDNVFIGCEGTTGTGGQAAFYVASSNNKLSNCKGWSSRRYGWQVTGDARRNSFSNCEGSGHRVPRLVHRAGRQLLHRVPRQQCRGWNRRPGQARLHPTQRPVGRVLRDPDRAHGHGRLYVV